MYVRFVTFTLEEDLDRGYTLTHSTYVSAPGAPRRTEEYRRLTWPELLSLLLTLADGLPPGFEQADWIQPPLWS